MPGSIPAGFGGRQGERGPKPADGRPVAILVTPGEFPLLNPAKRGIHADIAVEITRFPISRASQPGTMLPG